MNYSSNITANSLVHVVLPYDSSQPLDEFLLHAIDIPERYIESIL